MLLYRMMASLSFIVSFTISPFSSSTMRTSSGLGILLIMALRTYTHKAREREISMYSSRIGNRRYLREYGCIEDSAR